MHARKSKMINPQEVDRVKIIARWEWWGAIAIENRKHAQRHDDGERIALPNSKKKKENDWVSFNNKNNTQEGVQQRYPLYVSKKVTPHYTPTKVMVC